MQWYLTVFKKYADFSGRARRKEYWIFTLFNSIIILFLALLSFALTAANSSLGIVFMVIYCIYALAIIVPSLAVAVRRLHDTNRSGWFYLIGFIPVVGGIILLVFFCLDGNPDTNQYGPSPKESSPFDVQNERGY